MSIRLSRDFWVILFIALLVILVAGPFWQIDGIPVSTHDVQVHLFRSASIERAFGQGIYWPRWFPAVYNGLGAPIAHHYSPGLYWLIAIAHHLGLGLDLAMKLFMSLALVISGFGVYAWLRHTFSLAASLAAASIYLLHPMLLTRTVFYAGDYPQMFALLLLPVAFWSFTALFVRSSGGRWIAAVASLSALVISHNLMAIAAVGMLALYWLMLAAGYRSLGGMLRTGTAVLVAFILTAGFWLPALADLQHVQSSNVRWGAGRLSDLFLHWWKLTGFQSPLLDSRAGNPLMPLNTFGAASWLALIAGLLSLPFSKNAARQAWAIGSGLFSLAMLAMSSPVSEPLWHLLSALSMFQYPGRFLLIATIGALPAAAASVDAFRPNYRWLPGATFVVVSSVVLFPYLFPDHTPMFSSFSRVERLSVAEAGKFEARMNAWGLTSDNEFLVQGADLRIATGERAEPNATNLIWHSPHEAVADISGNSGPVLLRLHYHPGWNAGNLAQLARGPAGWMLATQLRASAQPLRIFWEGTTWQRWGERLTLLGLLATAAGTLFLSFRRDRAASAQSDGPRSSTPAAGVMTACLLFFVAARYSLDLYPQGPFLLDSPPGELAFSVDGRPTTLGDQETGPVTLLGWSLLSSDTPSPGETVSVRLYWQADAELSDDYHTFLHLHTPAIQRSWAVENQGVLRPPTRVWDPQKYYIETMRLRLPADIPPLTYTLVAGLVSSSGERLTVPGSVNDLVHLREMAVAPSRPGFLQSERPPVAADAATGDALRLQGYDLVPKAEQPDHLILRLFWETGNGPARDWITYIHLTDAHDNLVAQFDGPAFSGLMATGSWHTDSLYIDRRELHLPEDLDPGDYLFRIGLYSFNTGERLPFQPDDDTSHSFVNGQLLVPLQVAMPDRASD